MDATVNPSARSVCEKIETIRLQSSDEHQTNSDWNQHEYASDLAIANLLGAVE